MSSRYLDRSATALYDLKKFERKEQLMEQNEFYEEAEGLLYGAGIAAVNPAVNSAIINKVVFLDCFLDPSSSDFSFFFLSNPFFPSST